MQKVDLNKFRDLPGKVGDYLVERRLGVGTYGVVCLGIHELSREKVALKFIANDLLTETHSKNLEREIRIYKHLSHRNVVKLYEVLTLNKYTCLVMEFVNGGDLFELVENAGEISEQEVAIIFKQILLGVQYCHSQHVIHRDLKLENILMTNDLCTVKIADFGLANFIEEGSLLKTFCGSPLYAAPEILLAKKEYGSEVDVWSLGVVLYALVSGLFPWPGNNIQEQTKNALKGNFPLPENVSENCRRLIASMLLVDPTKRATISDILNSPWLVAVEVPASTDNFASL